LLGISSAKDDCIGKWCFPAGGIKADESPERAAEREFKEETGLRAYAIRSAFASKEKSYVSLIICKHVGGRMKPNHEFTKLNWFPIDKALELGNLFYPARRTLQRITNHL